LYKGIVMALILFMEPPQAPHVVTTILKTMAIVTSKALRLIGNGLCICRALMPRRFQILLCT
jgi:hypothetical protein